MDVDDDSVARNDWLVAGTRRPLQLGDSITIGVLETGLDRLG